MVDANAKLNEIFSLRWHDQGLVCDERSFTYAELYAHAAGIAQWLALQGCRPGDSIGLNLPNGWPFAIAYLACLLGPYRFIPINSELHERDQAYIRARSQPRVVLTDANLLAALPPCACVQPAFDYPTTDVAAVFFTSGTTGKPKGVCHSLNALVGNVIAFNQAHSLNTATRSYHVLPMAYMAGFLNSLLSPWLAGGVVLLGPRFRPADALQFWQKPLAWHANTIWLTPTLAAVLARVSRDPQLKHQVGTSMRHVFCGTAPLPNATRKQFKLVFSCPLQESYGMSEILLVSAQTREEAEHLSGVGRLLPGISISHREVAEMDTRELVIHTPWTLKHYLLEHDEQSPLLDDGGMPTGDAGDVNNGHLNITGRLKDLIIRGGLNVSPIVVEEILLREDGVVEAAVVGVANDFWGEKIVACLVATSDTDIVALETRLQIRCAVELSAGMRPDHYQWLASLPRASTGKIQKHRLREMLV